MNLAVIVANSLNEEKFCVNNSLDAAINENRLAFLGNLLILGRYFQNETISTMEDDVFGEVRFCLLS